MFLERRWRVLTFIVLYRKMDTVQACVMCVFVIPKDGLNVVDYVETWSTTPTFIHGRGGRRTFWGHSYSKGIFQQLMKEEWFCQSPLLSQDSVVGKLKLDLRFSIIWLSWIFNRFHNRQFEPFRKTHYMENMQIFFSSMGFKDSSILWKMSDFVGFVWIKNERNFSVIGQSRRNLRFMRIQLFYMFYRLKNVQVLIFKRVLRFELKTKWPPHDFFDP